MTERHASYRVSERSVLHPGTRFRTVGGPEWQLADGTRIRLSASGPFTFCAYCRQGTTAYIEATDRHGAQAILHISGGRKQIDPALIPKPYIIRSVVRKKLRTRSRHS